MKDYLILHRQILHWEWHDDAYMVSLFIHLLCMANYLPNYKYRGKVQRVGELHTSVPKLSVLTGMSQNTIISKLRRLQSTGEITYTSNKNGTDIYICHYAKYQFVAPVGSAPVAEQHEEHGAEQCNELLAEQSGVQCDEQYKNNTEVGENQPCSASSSAVRSATVAPQAGHNQEIYISNNINNKNNTGKEKSEAQITGNNAELEAKFDEFRKAYKGTKRGLKAEFDNFKNKNANWKQVVPLLMPALVREIEWREKMQAAGLFVPHWAYLQTWINQHRWETEFEEVTANTGTAAQAKQNAQLQVQPPSDDEYGGSFGGMD